MKTKFDDALTKAIKISSKEELPEGFTESIISRVLVLNRSKTFEPLIPKKFLFGLILTILAIPAILIILFDDAVYTSNINSTHFSNILEEFAGYSMEFSFMIFLIGIFTIIDFLADKYYKRKII
ncbi:MAG: hypothetical protein KIT33_02790 [Candidatus Kapabacteria bacterium]|nr:hypothetical protein [Ignavibacteriota bacterium]MCW5883876.1 hypothetical protein [Candidatus Kapabacteria bacterium]